jgi:amino acid adenylation domain-containing protein
LIATHDEQEVFVFPASFAQQRLWLIHQLEPDDPSYNVPTVLRLEGKLNVGALQQALDEVVRRHEVLRTTFAIVNDGPAQIIHPQFRIPIDVINLGDVPAAERWNEAMRRVTKEAWQPFDLEAGPLLRALLLRLEEDDHLSILTMHHIICDAWSQTVLVEEISALYDAYLHERPSPLAELAIQYADFAEWQQQWLTGDVLESQLAYWREQLDGAPSALNLPTDHPRPAIQSHRGATQAINLAPPVAQALKELSRQENATLFMTLLAGFKALLYRYTGQTDIVVGTPVIPRNQAETEKLIGFFTNTLALRTNLSGEPNFRELVRRVQEVALSAYAHQELPFEKLVEELKPERSLSYAPLFQVVFAFQSINIQPPALTGLRLSVPYIENTTAKFDLTFLAIDTEAGINCSLEYNTDLFDAATITRMLDHLQRLFEAAVANPLQRVGDLPLLSVAEQHQLLAEWNSTATEYPRHRCVHELFEDQAVQSAEATALVFEKETLTYRQLNERANQLAHHLRRLGVGPEETVGVLMDRSPELIVALLAILKAGGVYVPLNPAYPKERLALMYEDARLRVLITEETFADLDDEPSTNLDNHTTPENRAYVMYTSGSTGRPKGVNVEHRSIVRLVKNTNYADFSSAQTFLQFAPTTFDASTLEIWGSLLNGGRLVIMPRGTASPEELGNVLQRHEVTTLWLTAGLFHLMVDENLEGLRSVKQMIAGGDVLSPAHIAKVLREFPDCRVINGYGPTENTTFTCCHSMQAGDELGATVPIGRPISNTRVYLVNQRFQLVPAGVPGELLAAGDGLARDYLGDAALTAEKFIPDPFSAQPGGRLYRTGDLARYLPDGTIEFLGRADQQVKIRGFRIEPEEIEFVLERHPNVRRAVVQVNQDADGEKQLVAYVAINSEPGVGDDELREYLAEKLPDYMMPSAFVLMDELPLTTNGKVDRSRLPELGEWNANRQEYVAPSTPIEELVCNVFADVLRLQKVGASENFFQLGGHSLSATRVVSRVREAIGPIVSLRDLFEASTPALLARRIERAQQVLDDSGAPDMLPLSRVERNNTLPLSFAQQRLWFLDQLEPGSVAFSIPVAVRMRGRLDVATLAQALSEVVRRHEVLRTTFTEIDRVVVQVIGEPRDWPLPVEDLSRFTPERREAEVRAYVAAECARPFNLQEGPVLRTHLLRLGADEHVLLISMHHIATDGWSLGVLVREVAALYESFSRGEQSPLAELPIQYADYAAWQREWLQGDALERQMTYWRARLEDIPLALNLPADRPRPSTVGHRGDVEVIELGPELTLKLKELGRRENATLFMTLLAGWQALLARYTGQDNIVIGSPVAGRVRPELEGLIGLFVNLLVLRVRVAGRESFAQLVARVREECLGAYAHQDVPFEKLVEELDPVRDMSRHPLFQVMFILQNTPQEELKLSEMTLSMEETESVAVQCDMVLSISETPRGLTAGLTYSTDLFDRKTITRMLAHFETLLGNAVAAPDRPLSTLGMIDHTERRQLLYEWNETGREYVNADCIHELFEMQVARTPEAIALDDAGREVSYAELNRRANQLAHHLLALGAGPEKRAGIFMGRSAETFVALLGVLKAGAAYVSLDPAYPRERLAYMMEDAGIKILITRSQLAESFREHRARVVLMEHAPEIEHRADNNPGKQIAADAAAYIIYTSGSTGRPKGVVGLHGATVNRFNWMWETYPFAAGEICCQKTSMSFVDSVWETFGPLLQGVKTVVLNDETVKDGELFVATLAEKAVTRVVLVPSLLRALLEMGGDLAKRLPMLRYCVCSGEELTGELAREFRKRMPHCSLLNLYGSSEVAADATCYEVTGAELTDRVSIGRPIANTRVYVLDEHMHPVPAGVPGELYVGGAGLARGYVGSPELTADKFTPDPFGTKANARLYRTGDRARFRSDGNLEFLGRVDQQVKLRGFRIEIGEIEFTLKQCPGVRQSIVVARGEQLLAYVTTGSQETLTSSELRLYASGRLPEHMVPSAFMVVDEFPLTPSGKVDRRALAILAQEATALSAEEYAAPRTPVETLICETFADVLGLERIGIRDHFFHTGGHSLLATRVISRLRAAFNVTLRDLFEAPTAEALAARVEKGEERSAVGPELRARPRGDVAPLSFAQQRLWFLDQLQPGSHAFNVPIALRVSGPLQVAVLKQCLTELVRRHEVLRTTVTLIAGEPMQFINPPFELTLAVEDLLVLPDEVREAEVLRLSTEETRRPFDLVRGPVFRVRLLRTGEQEHVILFTMHHIVADAWSSGVLVEEVMALYGAYAEGRSSPLPELPIQYADFALWQREMLEGETLEGLIGYWKKQLHGVPQLNLPTDRPRPPVTSYRGASQGVFIDEALTSSLKSLGQQEDVTLFMTLLAAFQTLLYLYTKQMDIVVGTDIANRTREETERLIGFFVNMLALRTDLSGNPTFRELLKRVRQVTLDAYAHQDLPFEKLVAALNLERDLNRFPVFQAVLVLQNTPAGTLEISGLEMRPLPIENRTVKFDLIMFLTEQQGQLIGRLDYSTDLFDERTISSFLKNFKTTLEQVVAEPDVHVDMLKTITERKEESPDKEKEERARKKLGVVKRKTLDVAAANLVTTCELPCGSGSLLVAEPQMPNVNLAGWATSNRQATEEMLRRHGAVLWRGFDIRTVEYFETVARAMSDELFGEYGDLPRASVSGNVYGSTPYPADQAILFHNESSHMHRWPMKIWFYCAQAPAQGGETPIVDCRKIYQLLDPVLRERFARKKLMYVRNYTETLDVSWQDFFRTSDRAEVESYCRAAGIDYEWKDGNELRTRQVCQAIARHPRTGADVFFNQLQLHHVSCLAPATYESMRSLFREEDYPRNVCYGDGTPIEDSVVSEICDLYRQTSVSFTWQEGDILMLDNMLTAHGRNPYSGPRKIVVAMGDIMPQAELAKEASA